MLAANMRSLQEKSLGFPGAQFLARPAASPTYLLFFRSTCKSTHHTANLLGTLISLYELLLKQNTHLHSSICIFYKEVPHVCTWFSILVAPSANKTLQKIKTKWKYREIDRMCLSNFIDTKISFWFFNNIRHPWNVKGPQVTMCMDLGPLTLWGWWDGLY